LLYCCYIPLLLFHRKPQCYLSMFDNNNIIAQHHHTHNNHTLNLSTPLHLYESTSPIIPIITIITRITRITITILLGTPVAAQTKVYRLPAATAVAALPWGVSGNALGGGVLRDGTVVTGADAALPVGVGVGAGAKSAGKFRFRFRFMSMSMSKS